MIACNNVIRRSLRLRNSSCCSTNSRRDRCGSFLFSSSSSRKKHNQKREPHLTKRNKRDMFILATGICYVFGYYITSNDWDDDVLIIKNKLLSSQVSSTTNSSSTSNSISSSTNNGSTIPEITIQGGSYFDSNNNNNNNSDNMSPPSVVQRYLKKLSSSSSLPSSSSPSLESSSYVAATVTQSGEFLALNQWYPFTSDLFITAPPSVLTALPSNVNGSVANNNSCTLGFVWDAKTKKFKLSHRILESYNYNYNCSSQGDDDERVKGGVGIGNIITKLWGIFPFVLQLEEDDPYILFWLAMIIPLYPKIVLLNNKLLIWNTINNLHDHGHNDEISSSPSSLSSSSSSCIAKAELCCNDDNDKTSTSTTFYFLEFIFDNDTDLLTSIKVTERCRRQQNLTTNESNEQQPYWQVFYKDYKQVPASSKEQQQQQQRQISSSSSLLIPTTIEIGRGCGDNDNNDDNDDSSSSFRSHFKIHNHHIKYL